MNPRTTVCSEEIAAGRMRKAEQFVDAAETIREFADNEADVGDAYVTLLIHAGVAAADVVCCVSLGEHARGDSHTEAVDLLSRVSPDGDELAAALRRLLAAKTRAGYGYQRVNAETRVRSLRAAERLVRAARDRRASSG